MTNLNDDLLTLAVRIAAPRWVVFNFLANVENVPRWAQEFCERLEISHGRWLALTAAGELYVELQADERSGVIDLLFGEADRIFVSVSLRVLSTPDGASAVSLLCCRASHEASERFGQRCAAIEEGLRRLQERWAPPAVARVA